MYLIGPQENPLTMWNNHVELQQRKKEEGSSCESGKSSIRYASTQSLWKSELHAIVEAGWLNCSSRHITANPGMQKGEEEDDELTKIRRARKR